MKRDQEKTVAAREGDLRRLWSAATSRPMHGAHCSCCGGGLVQFNARALEDEILEFLIAKYSDQGESPVVTFLMLLQREKNGDLIDRLARHAPASGLTSEAAAQLTGDIASILGSMVDRTGSSLSGG